MKSDVSVIIATKDRAKSLYSCLYSFRLLKQHPLEIIIVDQSTNAATKNSIHHLNWNRIKYFHVGFVGKSNALNFAITKAKGNILAFTDDDCIVTHDWIDNIQAHFRRHTGCSGVFGQTVPFNSQKNKSKICVATFISNTDSIVGDSSIVHYETLGLGNNMSLRKSVFSGVGSFKEWLGPGTKVGAGAEESDLIYRCLASGHRLDFNHKLLVYHNRWLSYSEEKSMQAQYSSALSAFWIYHKLLRSKNFPKFMKNRTNNFIVTPCIEILHTLLQFRLRSFVSQLNELYFIAEHIYYLLRGALIGFKQFGKEYAQAITHNSYYNKK